MDVGLSTISANLSGMAEVPETIIVQAVDATGNLVTTGGETIALKIYIGGTTLNENYNYRSITMTDKGDGTYEASYLISGGSGTVVATLARLNSIGIRGDYYSGPSLTGTLTTNIDSQIDFAGLVSGSVFWSN